MSRRMCLIDALRGTSTVMGLGLLLVPALAGYLLQIQVNFFRYRTLRETGQHVVFRSALTGSILVFFAQLIVHCFSEYIPEPVDYINKVFGFEYTAAAVLSFFLALAIWPVANCLEDKNHAAIRAARENGELAGIFITEAIGTGRYVEISMDTGRVYIGHIVESGIGMSSQFDFMIVPLFSGHRDRETNELKLTQSYSRAIDEINAQGKRREELRICMALSRVVLVRFFDPSLRTFFGNTGMNDTSRLAK